MSTHVESTRPALHPPPGRPGGGASRVPLRLILFGLAAITAVAFGFLFHSAAEAGRLVQRFGYYVMTGTFLWWLFTLMRRWPSAAVWGRQLEGRARRQLVALVGALSVIAALTFPYSYKVLYDEFVLQATAWNLHYFREVGTVVRGYPIEGIFASLDVYVDKRPYFFPYLISLAHDLTGYRELNGFVLNTLLLPAVLVLFYALARRLAEHRAALAGLACFGASSLLAQNANGVGMELLNLAMLLLVMLLAADYLARPDEDRLSALILSAVLLAQTRYESSLFVLPTAIAVLEGWRRARRLILPAAALFAPLLLIPCALQNTYLAGTPLLWELPETMTSRFGVEFVADNLVHAGTFFFNFSPVILNSWWLAIAGWPALAWALVRTGRGLRHWRTAGAESLAVVLFACAVAANLLLLMFYFWGQLDDAIVARLVLPFSAIMGLAVAWAAQQLSTRRIGWRAARVLTVGALLTYAIFGLRASAYHGAINELATEIAWEGRAVASLPPKVRMVITNKSCLIWFLRLTPAISIDHGRQVAERVKFHLDHGTFQEVLVFQRLTPTDETGASFVVEPNDLLPADYVLEPVVERHTGTRIARISRVVAIRSAATPDKAESPISDIRNQKSGEPDGLISDF